MAFRKKQNKSFWPSTILPPLPYHVNPNPWAPAHHHHHHHHHHHPSLTHTHFDPSLEFQTPPELQPRAFRLYISSSASAPSFPTSSSSYNSDLNPNPSPGSTSYHDGSTSSRVFFFLCPQHSDRRFPGSFSHLPPRPWWRTIWFSLIAAQMVFFFSSALYHSFSHLPLALLAAITYKLANFLIGIWVSLQFKWIQTEYPTIVLALERLLFACAPLIASLLFTWATVSAVALRLHKRGALVGY